MLLKFRLYLFTVVLAFNFSALCNAQVGPPSDSLTKSQDSLVLKTDSIPADTSKVKKIKQDDEFKSKIEFTAKDSVTYSKDFQKAYLYGDAKVNYEDIELKAAYMEYDFATNTVFATFALDSAGNHIGLPDFKKGTETFKSDKLTYSFKTKKGVITNIVAEQQGGFLHAQKTKREADGSINIKNGIYTTCDAPHPHFGIVITKGKVIQNDKIISGPAYLEFEDVPLPLFLPFGFFPNSKKSSVSGIIMPTIGSENTRGFYLINGGYYFALSKYYDLLLTADVYSKGNWGMDAKSKYTKRYKFTGNFEISRYVNKSGLLGVDSGANKFTRRYDFKILWNHAQAATANPSQHFSASVNYTSTTYDKNYDYFGSQGAQNLINTQKQSSISYSKTWTNANLSVSLNGSQNSTNNSVTATLPSTSFSLNRIYPFRKKESSGSLKWYENITINYQAQMSNVFTGIDSTIFSKKTLNTARNGFQHTLPFGTNIKFLKYFNFSPSLNYAGVLYTSQIEKSLEYIYDANNKLVPHLKLDTIHRLSYAQGFAPTAGLSFNPTIYGMYQFGPKSKLNAIRHVITISVGAAFVPEINHVLPNYYKTYKDTSGHDVSYSIYEGQPFSTPPSMSHRSGTLSFSLGNNLEMKVKSDKDTVTGLKKIVLIQSLSFSSSYNIYATTNKLSNINWSGNTPILKGLNVSYNGVIDPYVRKVNTGDSTLYYWQKHKRPGRLTSAGLSFGYTFQSGGAKATTADGKTPTESKTTDVNKDDTQKPKKPVSDFSYFKIPWSFNFSYNLMYSKPNQTKSVIQSLSFGGNVNLTSKWSMTFTSAYDFTAKNLGLSSVTITRNLHCFSMVVNFVPFGPNKYYNFRIFALSQFLSDLKYEQRKDYRDYQTGF